MNLDIVLRVNGISRPVRVAPTTTLLDVLREQLLLTGAKRGCNQGVCGACTVLLDGRPVRACLSLAVNSTDQDITTIEGMAEFPELTPLQQSFVDHGAVQCGFCSSGMILTAAAYLGDNPKPTVEEARVAISGNLCRCSGYKKIVDAVVGAGGVR